MRLRSFHENIIRYFDPLYRQNKLFLKCVLELRRILYTDWSLDDDEHMLDEDLTN